MCWKADQSENRCLNPTGTHTNISLTVIQYLTDTSTITISRNGANLYLESLEVVLIDHIIQVMNYHQHEQK